MIGFNGRSFLPVAFTLNSQKLHRAIFAAVAILLLLEIFQQTLESETPDIRRAMSAEEAIAKRNERSNQGRKCKILVGGLKGVAVIDIYKAIMAMIEV